MNFYKQCILHKTESGDEFEGYILTKQTTWIPEQFAHIGNYIKLKQKNGTWEDGWQIVEVGTREAEDIVVERSQDHKHQRKASDI